MNWWFCFVLFLSLSTAARLQSLLHWFRLMAIEATLRLTKSQKFEARHRHQTQKGNELSRWLQCDTRKLTIDLCLEKDAIRCPWPSEFRPGIGLSTAARCPGTGILVANCSSLRCSWPRQVTDCMPAVPPGIQEAQKQSCQDGRNIIGCLREQESTLAGRSSSQHPSVPAPGGWTQPTSQEDDDRRNLPSTESRVESESLNKSERKSKNDVR